MSISIPEADYSPQLAGYTGQGAFRFWCQKVLPIVYDDSLSYYELLNKIVVYLNNVISDVAAVEDNVGELSDAYTSLQNYVNEHTQEIASVVNEFTDFVTNYFNNLDVQQEINHKLDEMAINGDLSDVVAPIVVSQAPDIITEWLNNHITPTSPPVDDTLSISGAAADAKVTGDRIGGLLENSYNLFDVDSFVHSWYNASGTLVNVDDPVYAMSPLIAVIPGKYYCLQSDPEWVYGMQFAWFDSDNTFIKRDNWLNPEETFTHINAIAPSNASFVRASIYTGPTTHITLDELKQHHIMLSESAFEQNYSPYNTTHDFIARDECNKIEDFPDMRGGVVHPWTLSDWIQGSIGTDNGILDPFSNTRIASGYFYLADVTQLKVATDNQYEHRCIFYDKEGAFISTTEQLNWRGVSRSWTIPNNAFSFRVCIRNKSNATITPSENTNCVIYRFTDYALKRNSFLMGKKLSILGDSLSTYAGVGVWNTQANPAYADGVYCYAGNLCRYPQFGLLQNARDMYWMKLIEEYNMTLGVNESYAGSKVSGSDNIAISSLYRIGHLDDNGTPDIILVNAGTNDINSPVSLGTFNTENPTNYTEEEIASLPVTTFADAYRTMIIRLQYYYPTSKIVVLLPNYTTSYATPERVDEFNEMIKTVCDYFGVLYIDTRTTGITFFNKLTYVPDTVHYNELGMELLYRKIRNSLIGQFG